jgi:hypothetical protein
MPRFKVVGPVNHNHQDYKPGDVVDLPVVPGMSDRFELLESEPVSAEPNPVPLVESKPKKSPK